MRNILLFISILLSTIALSQRINPNDVILICSNQQIVGQTPQSTNYTSLRTSCEPFLPLTSTLALFYVEIVSGSTFTFTISPQGPVDYDFASWQNPNFTNLGPSDRGSQNDGIAAGLYDIGLSLTETMLCERGGVRPGTGAATVPGFVRYYDVQPGDGILIAINRWSATDAGFRLSFGGDAVLNCDILPKEYEVCDEDHDKKEIFDLNIIRQEINNIANTYVIDFFENAADAIDINATNSLPNTYELTIQNSPKTLYARYMRANGLFVKTREIRLKVNEMPKEPENPFVYEICSNKTENEIPFASFDLTKFESSLQEGHIFPIKFSYHKGEIVSTENKINNPKNYIASEETITVVMTIKDLCPVEFIITIKANKIDIDSSDITYSEYCAQESETGLIYNLENTINILLQNKSKEPYTIDFYLTNKEAKDEENKILAPTEFLITYNTNQTIYVRISDENGCYVISTIQLHSKPRFRLDNQVNEKCEPFMLPELPKGYAYYTEPNKKGNKITPSTLESILYGPKEIYIYGEDDYGLPTLNNCFFETSFTITTNGCMISRGISPNGDNINDYFDLKSYGVIKLSIFNRYGTEVYSKSNYIDEWNGQNNNNKLLPAGTYMYYFESIKGQFTGWIELMY